MLVAKKISYVPSSRQSSYWPTLTSIMLTLSADIPDNKKKLFLWFKSLGL